MSAGEETAKMQYSYQERKGASTAGVWAVPLGLTAERLKIKAWSTEQCRCLNPGVPTD